jgi:hypothetical protein
VGDRLRNLPLYSAAEAHRFRRGPRFLVLLAATTALGLVAPKPALALPGEEPPPTTADALVDAMSAPSLELPAAPAEELATVEDTLEDATEQIVTTVQADAGNVDVSVRVLSPGVDGPISQETSPPPVVSDDEAPSITTASEPTDGSGGTTNGVAGNTTVNVRVLSPGDDGPVTQTGGSGGDARSEPPALSSQDEPEVEPAAELTEGDTSAATVLSDDNSQRYHEEDSQYQSDSDTGAEPWHWAWDFSIDCAGNATSLSTETGSRSSLTWSWDWSWDWDCSDPERAPPTPATDTVGDQSSSGAPSSSGATANTNVSIRVLSPGDNGPVTQTNTTPDGTSEASPGQAPAGAPWSWSWTFTFCGQTTTFTTDVDSQSPLTWGWDWAWNWTCDAGVGPPPDLDGPSAGTGTTPLPPQSVVIPAAPAPLGVQQDLVEAPEPTVPTPSAAEIIPSIDLVLPAIDIPAIDTTVDVAIDFDLPSRGGALTPNALPTADLGDVDVLVAVDAETSPALEPLPASGAPDEWTQPPSGGVSATSISHPEPSRPVTQSPPVTPSPRVSSEKTSKHVSARPAPPDRRRPLPLLGQPRSAQTSGPGTSGGRVPSTPVVAVAALLAFFMLAAPRVGRRIRVARELSPRSAHPSSIDHPG